MKVKTPNLEIVIHATELTIHKVNLNIKTSNSLNELQGRKVKLAT